MICRYKNSLEYACGGSISGKDKSLLLPSFKCFAQDEFSTELIPGFLTPIYACQFGKGQSYCHLVAFANETGYVAVQDTQCVDRTHCAYAGGKVHTNAIFDLQWFYGCPELVTVGGGDAVVRICHIREDGIVSPVSKFCGHLHSIKSVDINPFDQSILATGGRDGNIIIWDKRCHPNYKADELVSAHSNRKTLNSPSCRRIAAVSHMTSITSLVFQQQQVLISVGDCDGVIKLWDLRKTHSNSRKGPVPSHTLIQEGNSVNGFISLCLSPDYHYLYASCMDNAIYAYHLANPTLEPIRSYFGHCSESFYCKAALSSCGSYLMSGSRDNYVYIWVTDLPGPPAVRLTGNTEEVSALAWCPQDSGKIVTCSDDMKHRIYRAVNICESDSDVTLNIRGRAEKCEGKATYHNFPGTPRSRKPLTDLKTPVSVEHLNSPFQTTPKQRQPTPNTPKTGEQKTLLGWLSSTKKSSSAIGAGSPLSTSKKAKTKRKLTDFLEENSENSDIVMTQCVKSPKISNATSGSTGFSKAAKTLQYPAWQPGAESNPSAHADAILPLDDCEDMLMMSNVVIKYSNTSVEGYKFPFRTPTSDLPNFIADGTSPHVRPEKFIPVKKPADWLTQLSRDCKLQSKSFVCDAYDKSNHGKPCRKKRILCIKETR